MSCILHAVCKNKNLSVLLLCMVKVAWQHLAYSHTWQRRGASTYLAECIAVTLWANSCKSLIAITCRCCFTAHTYSQGVTVAFAYLTQILYAYVMCYVDCILIDIFIYGLVLLGLNIQKNNLFLLIHESFVDSWNISTIAVVCSQTTWKPTARTAFTTEIHRQSYTILILFQAMSPGKLRILLEITKNTAKFTLPKLHLQVEHRNELARIIQRTFWISYQSQDAFKNNWTDSVTSVKIESAEVCVLINHFLLYVVQWKNAVAQDIQEWFDYTHAAQVCSSIHRCNVRILKPYLTETLHVGVYCIIRSKFTTLNQFNVWKHCNRLCYVFCYRYSVFLNDIAFLEHLSEYIRCIFTQASFAVWAIANGSRSADRTQCPLRQIQLQLQTSNQICHISTLCAIICMQLIEHDKLQSLDVCINIAFP